MLFFVACISCITVACDSDDDGTKGDDNKFPAPEVTFSAITGVSFTAGWNALETADSYRYEVSYEKDGQVVAVAAQNTETTTLWRTHQLIISVLAQNNPYALNTLILSALKRSSKMLTERS
jgi:hypothetical protein